VSQAGYGPRNRCFKHQSIWTTTFSIVGMVLIALYAAQSWNSAGLIFYFLRKGSKFWNFYLLYLFHTSYVKLQPSRFWSGHDEWWEETELAMCMIFPLFDAYELTPNKISTMLEVRKYIWIVFRRELKQAY